MKHRFSPALIAVPLALLLCLALYYFTPVSKQARGNLTLWYAETDCPREVMEALLTDYQNQTRRLVTAAAFPDEQALAAAFETGRPDLLFCSHVRAWDLDEREGLTALQNMPPLPASLDGVSPQLGVCFFPLGARLPLLVSGGGAAPETLEALFRRAAESGTPCLGADSWADVLYQGMFSLGRELHGSLKADQRDEAYRKLYNALAQAAYSGGIARVQAVPEHVRQGLLEAVIVSSSALAGLEDEAGLAVSPLPPPEGGRQAYSAELMGFAVLADEKTRDEARAFLEWLSTGDNALFPALQAGLVPMAAPAEAAGESAFARLLLSLSRGASLRYPDPGCDFCQNREALEARLRQSLDLLA